MSVNLIQTQELGKPREKVIPQAIRDIVARMHHLRAEKAAKEQAAKKKVKRKEAEANFDVVALLGEVAE